MSQVFFSVFLNCPDFNLKIPKDSRFTTNASFFTETIKSLESEEGKAKIEKVRKLSEVAKKLGTTVTALSLAWAANNPAVSTVILGASKPEQFVVFALRCSCCNSPLCFHRIIQNLEALHVIDKLTPGILQEIETILDNTPKAPATFGR